jgi:hypothetical protein
MVFITHLQVKRAMMAIQTILMAVSLGVLLRLVVTPSFTQELRHAMMATESIRMPALTTLLMAVHVKLLVVVMVSLTLVQKHVMMALTALPQRVQRVT